MSKLNVRMNVLIIPFDGGHMIGYEHSAKELRELADELWDRGFKEISSEVHRLAAIKEAKQIKEKKGEEPKVKSAQKTFR